MTLVKVVVARWVGTRDREKVHQQQCAVIVVVVTSSLRQGEEDRWVTAWVQPNCQVVGGDAGERVHHRIIIVACGRKVDDGSGERHTRGLQGVPYAHRRYE